MKRNSNGRSAPRLESRNRNLRLTSSRRCPRGSRANRLAGSSGCRRRAAADATHLTSGRTLYYADFRDVAFWRLQEASVRYIGGYVRMSWVSEAEWQAAEPDPLGPSAEGTIAHMNADHAEAMVLYCKAFSKAMEITAASMTGVDRYGFEMSAKTTEGPRPVRLEFTKPVSTPEEARAALISMLKDARNKLACQCPVPVVRDIMFCRSWMSAVRRAKRAILVGSRRRSCATRRALLHASEPARIDPDPQFLHRPMRHATRYFVLYVG